MMFLSFRGLASAMLTCVLIVSARWRKRPAGRRAPSRCSRMSVCSTARAPRYRLHRTCWFAATRSKRSRRSPIPRIVGLTPASLTAGGRTLMPGLIDAHWHAMMVRPTPAQLLSSDVGYTNLLAGAEATATLMRGFTTVRDLGGPTFGLKRAIDDGMSARTAHLSVRCDDHGHQRPRRLPPALRSAEDHWRDAHPHRAARRQHDRRQPGRGSPARARAAHAGRVADQADGGRRRGVAVQSARRVDVHRSRASRRGRSGRELGNLRRHARLHAGLDPALDRRRRQSASSTVI